MVSIAKACLVYGMAMTLVSYVDDKGPARWLEVWEGNNGRRAYLTLYERDDEVIW